MSLKRHRSVVFVGIDALDDIRNNSYIELFVSGGCIVSDELVLNPDFITHGMAGFTSMTMNHSEMDFVNANAENPHYPLIVVVVR